jgi:tetratricopeptide (TPR) repeat protein
VPTWAAVKASYCLSLCLPYALFTTRAVEALLSRAARWQRVAPLLALLAAAVAAAVVGSSGVALPRRRDAPAAGAVRYYFGEYEQARRVYGPYLAETLYKPPWLENLAAVELAEGNADRARRLYARAVALAGRSGRSDPHRAARHAVAAALDGDLESAREALDRTLAEEALPEPLANRGTIRAVQGDLAGAAADLRSALELEPGLVPAWRNLSVVLERDGRRAEAEVASRRAAGEACVPPRRYPYGVGTGEILEWGVGRRPLLLLEDAGLRPTLPEYYRTMCRTEIEFAPTVRE